MEHFFGTNKMKTTLSIIALLCSIALCQTSQPSDDLKAKIIEEAKKDYKERTESLTADKNRAESDCKKLSYNVQEKRKRLKADKSSENLHSKAPIIASHRREAPTR